MSLTRYIKVTDTIFRLSIIIMEVSFPRCGTLKGIRKNALIAEAWQAIAKGGHGRNNKNTVQGRA